MSVTVIDRDHDVGDCHRNGEDPMKTYAGKTALVTGASSGIGRAFAVRLAQRGADLIVVARSKGELEALAAELKGVRVSVIAADLALPGAATRLAQEVAARGLKVDLLVNNAGFGKWGNFLDIDTAAYGQMVDLNCRAVVELCHAFLPAMAARGDGGVINVGSTASYVPVPWSAVYGATKAFVLSLSEALSVEFGGKGVQITALCPGATNSNFARVAHADAAVSDDAGDPPELVADVGLDALLAGKMSVIAGKRNQSLAWIPRLVSRDRAVKLVGRIWAGRLKAQGVAV
jgi:uncharacterized protein